MLDHSQNAQDAAGLFARFQRDLGHGPDVARALKNAIIGKDAVIPGPSGPNRLIYADHVASGRALRQVEDFVLQRVLPYYANSHTEASFCGAYTTALREAARAYILRQLDGAEDQHAVLFVGAGATAGLNRLVHLFDIRNRLSQGREVTVLVGPYEHHSNLLPWRESGARVIEIAEGAAGGPDPDDLGRKLDAVRPGTLLIAAFSAASNVTGITCDVAALTRQIKAAGGLMVWDFAGAGPYLPMSLTPAPDAAIDAIVLSAHKFIGGPGASGILALRRDAVSAATPGQPGGGTVVFVNAHVHDYVARIEEREEGGTPNIIGDIRAALAFAVKAALGTDFITGRNDVLTRKTIAAFAGDKHLRLLGGARRDRLPIFSFTLGEHGANGFDYQGFTRALSDRYGIQMRGGCACAGPYVHRLLNISANRSDALRQQVLGGDDAQKPGFVRFNLSFLMSDQEVDFILGAIAELAREA